MSNQELTGTVVRGVGGFYYVHAQGQVYECRARGRFRLDEISPLVGDQVVIAPDEGKTTGFVTEILPRKNLLTRPPCANVDRFVLVLSAHLPKADLLLADKLLLQAALQKVEPMICLNKCDLASPDEIGSLAKDFRALGAPRARPFGQDRAGHVRTCRAVGRKDQLLCRAERRGQVLAPQRPGPTACA